MWNPIRHFSNLGLKWLLRSSAIGSFQEISLASISDDHSDFLGVIQQSLELIQNHDPRRFRRVELYTRWITNTSLSGGAYSGEYWHRIKATMLDFEFDREVGDALFHAAYFAGVIVHEATHGVIRGRGIDTNRGNRIQVERICRAEENRFLGRLLSRLPQLEPSLIRPFDPKDWSESWGDSAFKKFLKGHNKKK